MPPAPDPDSRAGDLYLVFLATPALVRDNLARMLRRPPLSRLSQDGRGTAELVLAEVLNNVTEHAYAAGAGPVSVTFRPEDKGVRCLIVDQGAPIPGGTLPEGRLPGGPGTALQDLPEGGFGWHLIRTLTADLVYQRQDGRNRLSFLLPDRG